MTENAPRSCNRRCFVAGLVLGGLGGAAAMWLSRRWMVAGGTAPAVSTLDHARYMRLAIAQARNVPELPFGAVIVHTKDGAVLAEGHNRSKENPTWHGEIDVINRLAATQTITDWSPLALYTTAEPCPMCQSAIEWAGIGLVVFGTSIPFLLDAGWWQIGIRAEEVIHRTPFRKTALLGGVLKDECDPMFVSGPPGLYRDKK